MNLTTDEWSILMKFISLMMIHDNFGLGEEACDKLCRIAGIMVDKPKEIVGTFVGDDENGEKK